MENLAILAELFDSKMLGVLKELFSDREQQWGVRELARAAKVPPATTHRILKRLMELDIVHSQGIKSIKLYSLAKNEKVTFLESFIKQDRRVLDVFVSDISQIQGAEQVILIGKPTKNKASIILIGDIIAPEAVKQIIFSIREEFQYTINHFTLTKEQYQQMLNMGLYPGEKKVLWSRNA